MPSQESDPDYDPRRDSILKTEGGGEGKWTKDEDRTLLEMIKIEKPWKDISDAIPGRSMDACKKRHIRLQATSDSMRQENGLPRNPTHSHTPSSTSASGDFEAFKLKAIREHQASLQTEIPLFKPPDPTTWRALTLNDSTKRSSDYLSPYNEAVSAKRRLTPSWMNEAVKSPPTPQWAHVETTPAAGVAPLIDQRRQQQVDVFRQTRDHLDQTRDYVDKCLEIMGVNPTQTRLLQLQAENQKLKETLEQARIDYQQLDTKHTLLKDKLGSLLQ